MQPALGVDGRFGQAEIATHLRRRAQQDFALGKAGVFEELHFDAGQRPAGRTELRDIFRTRRRGSLAAVFGEAVAGGNARAHHRQAGADAPHQLGRDRRATDADRLQARQVAPRQVGVIEQARHHRGHRIPAPHLVAFDQGEHRARIVPAGRQHQRVAGHHGAQQALHAADVKQRAGEQGDVGGRGGGVAVGLVRQLFRDREGHVQARQHRAVRQHHGLGLARGAGGEDDEGGVFLAACGRVRGRRRAGAVRRGGGGKVGILCRPRRALRTLG